MMRNRYKLLILLGILVVIFSISNMAQILLFMEFLMETGYVWIIAALILSIPFVYWLFSWLEVWSSLKAARRIKQDKKIPQSQRIEIARDWIESNWNSRTAGQVLVMVNNYFTPERDDAQPMEMFLFTTERAYAEQRMSEPEIRQEFCFYVCENCRTGECFSMDYLSGLTFKGAVQFVNRYFFMSIKQKVETPMEQWMMKAMAEATGEGLVRKHLSTEKEEVKNEKKPD